MSAQELYTLIAQGEGFTSEFKRSMPSDLGREMCAFANASGGVILLGVTDKGKIVGTKLAPSWHQVGTKSGPSRDQVGTKSPTSYPASYPASTLQVRGLLQRPM